MCSTEIEGDKLTFPRLLSISHYRNKMGGVDIVSLAYSVTVTAGGLMGYVRAGNVEFVFSLLCFVVRYHVVSTMVIDLHKYIAAHHRLVVIIVSICSMQADNMINPL